MADTYGKKIAGVTVPHYQLDDNTSLECDFSTARQFTGTWLVEWKDMSRFATQIFSTDIRPFGGRGPKKLEESPDALLGELYAKSIKFLGVGTTYDINDPAYNKTNKWAKAVVTFGDYGFPFGGPADFAYGHYPWITISKESGVEMATTRAGSIIIEGSCDGDGNCRAAPISGVLVSVDILKVRIHRLDFAQQYEVSAYCDSLKGCVNSSPFLFYDWPEATVAFGGEGFSEPYPVLAGQRAYDLDLTFLHRARTIMDGSDPTWQQTIDPNGTSGWVNICYKNGVKVYQDGNLNGLFLLS